MGNAANAALGQSEPLAYPFQSRVRSLAEGKPFTREFHVSSYRAVN
jgi:hypothetical protein